ncbi:MAG: hypothetical protein AB7F22_29170 [Reyranella sp.]|uniref:hypothetical protein n=1 Tax=Reyranella sp. TaxID=1929291 RepID=UPI003D137BD0
MFRRTLLAALLAVSPVLAQPVAAPDCTVDVQLSERGGLGLEVTYRCRAAQSLAFEMGEARAAPYVGGLRVEQGNGIAEARYHFDLSDFTGTVQSTSLAVQRGNGVLATLGSWLLEPRGYDRPPVIDIRINAEPGLAFAAGLPKVGDAWRLAGTTVRFAGYTALGRLTYRELAVPAPGSLRPGQPASRGVLRVALLDGVAEGSRADVLDWVERTAQAQANYWQGFTARQALVGLVPMPDRRGVGYGRSVPGGGVTVMVEIGNEVDRHRLFGDWVLTHELVHTGMPFIRGRGSWFMEGAATYVEPIIRARAGWKTEEEVWREWVDNMPKGVPAFASGLANASGRENYWGGATFMLLADLAIRRASQGARGLEDCLGGVLWSGLDGARRASVGDYAAACDRATGTQAMSALVDRHFNRGGPLDLAALWKELGVSLIGGRIALDDSAPSAAWRKMIVPGNRPPKPVKLPWQS